MASSPFKKGSTFGARNAHASRYKPGARGFSQRLARMVVDSYLDDTLLGVFESGDCLQEERFERCAAFFAGMLRPEFSDEFDHNSFLEEVVFLTAINPKNPPKHHYQRVDAFFSPLVQALYELGCNNFVLDMSTPEMDSLHMASYLRGKKGNRLNLEYSGKVCSNFGFGIEHCNLSIEGKANWVATSAKHSSIDSRIISGGQHRPDYGKESDWCDFHVYDGDFTIIGYPNNANFFLYFEPGEARIAPWLMRQLEKRHTRFLVQSEENIWEKFEPRCS